MPPAIRSERNTSSVLSTVDSVVSIKCVPSKKKIIDSGLTSQQRTTESGILTYKHADVSNHSKEYPFSQKAQCHTFTRTLRSRENEAARTSYEQSALFYSNHTAHKKYSDNSSACQVVFCLYTHL